MSLSHKKQVSGGGCEIVGDEGEIGGPSKRDNGKGIEHTCKEGKKASSLKKKLMLPGRSSSSSSRRKRKKSDGKVMNKNNNNQGNCFVCFKRPSTLDGDYSPPSDPNSPNFTYGMLRNFMENNGFYDKDCNPHLDDDQ